MSANERKRKKPGRAAQLAIGILAEIFLLLVMLAILAALASKGIASESSFGTLSALSCFIAATTGTAVCGRLYGSGGLQRGIAVSGALVLIILCCSVLMGENHAPSIRAFTSMGAAAAGGVFGGMLGTKRKKRRIRA